MALQDINQAAEAIVTPAAEGISQGAQAAGQGIARSASTVKNMVVNAVRNNQSTLIVVGTAAAVTAAAYGGWRLYKKHKAKKVAEAMAATSRA